MRVIYDINNITDGCCSRYCIIYILLLLLSRSARHIVCTLCGGDDTHVSHAEHQMVSMKQIANSKLLFHDLLLRQSEPGEVPYSPVFANHHRLRVRLQKKFNGRCNVYVKLDALRLFLMVQAGVVT